VPSHPAFTPNWNLLLGRDPAPCRPNLIPGLAGRRILVTGAGGFIGSQMVRIFAASGAERIVLLEIAEQSLFDIASEITSLGFGDRIIPVLGSVCNLSLLGALFDEHRPELVIHAAALKHVPLMERNPFAAVATNGIATWQLAKVAAEHRARMILISTDKAVAPHSIMGASKRIAELAILAHPQFAALRLVNVIGSPGSVGPIFAEQIARRVPVSVTHPRAQRFFMTLGEVVALLAETISAESAHGILVPDPGDPILIADLARRMIAAAGSDASIVFTELRPGDKLEESLTGAGEQLAASGLSSLRQVLSPTADDPDPTIRALEAAVAARDLSQLLSLVQHLVPDYEPSILLREPALALSAS